MSQAHQAPRNQVAIEALEGRSFGPARLRVCREKVAEYVAATGDDPYRWIEVAPPSWAATALFAVAPLLLNDEAVAASAVIHGEQRFAWRRPIEVEADLEVLGEVTRVRERGGVWFLTFDLTVTDSEGDLLTGSSLFLASGASAPAAAEIEEAEIGPNEKSEGQFSASRSDLVRYAAATRDWNPIHWDHRSAVAAGLPGIVVHGLLQAAWILGKVTSPINDAAPVETARFRFRSPLPVGRAAAVLVDEKGREAEASLIAAGQQLVSAVIGLR